MWDDEKKREYFREYAREHKESIRRNRKRYYEKIKADPKRYARYLSMWRANNKKYYERMKSDPVKREIMRNRFKDYGAKTNLREAYKIVQNLSPETQEIFEKVRFCKALQE